MLRYLKSRFLSSVAIMVLLFLTVLIPSFLLLIALADQAWDFYNYARLQLTQSHINELISGNEVINQIYAGLNIDRGEIIAKVVKMVEQASLNIFSNITRVITFSIGFALNFIFMLLILFFLLKDAYRMEESFYRILPFPDDIEKDVVDRLKQVVKMLLAGNLLIMTLQGLMVGLGIFFAGISGPLLWGSISAILSLIPVIGTSLVWLPAVIFLTLTGNYLAALLLAVWCTVWYLVLENLLKPALFGKKLNFHPLIFFFLLLGSIKALGLPGVIIGPILLTLFFSLWEIYKLISGYDKAG